MWLVCIQAQIASTCSFSAQEKGKQPKGFLESGIREITFSLIVLDYGQMQQCGSWDWWWLWTFAKDDFPS